MALRVMPSAVYPIHRRAMLGVMSAVPSAAMSRIIIFRACSPVNMLHATGGHGVLFGGAAVVKGVCVSGKGGGSAVCRCVQGSVVVWGKGGCIEDIGRVGRCRQEVTMGKGPRGERIAAPPPVSPRRCCRGR